MIFFQVEIMSSEKTNVRIKTIPDKLLFVLSIEYKHHVFLRRSSVADSALNSYCYSLLPLTLWTVPTPSLE